MEFSQKQPNSLIDQFITKEAVAAIALGFLVAAAVDESAASSSAVVGVFTLSLAEIFEAFPSFSRKVLNPAASIVLSELN